jgi:hypothetical protein
LTNVEPIAYSMPGLISMDCVPDIYGPPSGSGLTTRARPHWMRFNAFLLALWGSGSVTETHISSAFHEACIWGGGSVLLTSTQASTNTLLRARLRSEATAEFFNSPVACLSRILALREDDHANALQTRDPSAANSFTPTIHASLCIASVE